MGGFVFVAGDDVVNDVVTSRDENLIHQILAGTQDSRDVLPCLNR